MNLSMAKGGGILECVCVCVVGGGKGGRETGWVSSSVLPCRQPFVPLMWPSRLDLVLATSQ